ncbi:uncharacterized protein DUF2812 [Pseudoduganella flava]|uniref:DUF2812 domain-containing protein n=1 Tax=Pseudoduganella flava TaxID=871742 RepID=A0A562PGF2_9BURK|nr:DUF2812 domain-containing protein [Pseudoduganella flava]QGZ40265.1 DUF2812 domain-containing protein [Pseudoduganella flava]TWI43448.1 uncharacterized protein DUF2812 [Pseudoduganella flava]
MDGKRVRKLKLGSAWHPERIERWLEEQSARGLHLESVGPFGVYTFRADLPEPFDYRIDFASTREIEDPNYHQEPTAAGWTLAGNSMSWMLWRAPKGEARDIFTHGPARAATYRRQALTMLLISVAQVPPLASGIMALRRHDELAWASILMLSSAVMSLSLYALTRAAGRLREVKARSPN